MAADIHQRTRLSLYLRVVVFAIKEHVHLLHVRCPVDLGIYTRHQHGAQPTFGAASLSYSRRELPSGNSHGIFAMMSRPRTSSPSTSSPTRWKKYRRSKSRARTRASGRLAILPRLADSEEPAEAGGMAGRV